VSEDECEKEQFDPVGNYDEAVDRANLFLLNYAEGDARRDLRGMTLSGLEGVEEGRAKQEKEGGDAATKLTLPMEEKLNKMIEHAKNDGFAGMTPQNDLESDTCKRTIVPLNGSSRVDLLCQLPNFQGSFISPWSKFGLSDVRPQPV
jgi:hypothetical protein